MYINYVAIHLIVFGSCICKLDKELTKYFPVRER